MEFTKVAQASTIAPGSMRKVVHRGQEILIANVDGTFYAIPDKCPHAGNSLAEGTLRGGIITCRRHGAQIDVRTGHAVGSAKILFIKIKVKDTPSFPIKVEGDDILIAIDG